MTINMMKGGLIIGVFVLLLAAVQRLPVDYSTVDEALLETEYGTVHLEVANTFVEHTHGLSNRADLDSGEGMFFVFPMEEDHGFWMKEMNFPIDIVWLDSSFKVVHVLKDVSPATYPETFHSPYPSQYVLELATSKTKTLHINVGDVLQIKPVSK